MNKIEKFRNKYKGERCFLVGNGPSLAHTPLELLKEEYTFGVNRIADIYPMTTWRPSFYVVVNRGVRVWPSLAEASLVAIRDTVSFICAGSLSALFGTTKMDVPGGGQTDVCRVPPNVYPMRVTFKHYIPQIDPSVWSHDIAKSVSKDGSSMFAVMQIAVYMGFNPIYLLGCDLGHKPFDWGGKDPNHFSEGYFGQLRHTTGDPFIFTAKRAKEADAYMLSGHATAKEVCDQLGVEIYNATIGGELEIFPRVDLMEII